MKVSVKDKMSIIEKDMFRFFLYLGLLIVFSIIGMDSEQYFSIIVVSTLFIISEIQYQSSTIKGRKR